MLPLKESKIDLPSVREAVLHPEICKTSDLVEVAPFLNCGCWVVSLPCGEAGPGPLSALTSQWRAYLLGPAKEGLGLFLEELCHFYKLLPLLVGGLESATICLGSLNKSD